MVQDNPENVQDIYQKYLSNVLCPAWILAPVTHDCIVCVPMFQLTRRPQGFKSDEQMRDVFSKPLGREFNTEQNFKERNKPKTIVTRVGQILEPMSEDLIFNKGSKITSDIELSKNGKEWRNKMEINNSIDTDINTNTDKPTKFPKKTDNRTKTKGNDGAKQRFKKDKKKAKK